MPKVSIVMPVYNGGIFLSESIESVINQTYADWELIIVDDGSTDGSSFMIDEFVKKDIRIRAIHKEKNENLPNALNTGFRDARGEYLTWTSADNIYLSNAIEEMTLFLDEHLDTLMVCADYDVIDENDDFVKSVQTYCDEKMWIDDGVGACFMYRNSAREKVGEYAPDLYGAEDYEYWFRIFLLGVKAKKTSIGRTEKTLYKYRHHEGRISITKMDKVRESLSKMRLRYYEEILEHIKNDDEALLQLYFGLMQTGDCPPDLKRICVGRFPELKGDRYFGDEKKYVLWGAGDVGFVATEKFGDTAAFLADSDRSKVGKIINGLEVIHFEDMIRMKDEYHIAITMGDDLLGRMIRILTEAGVKEFCTYPMYRACQNN